MIEDHRIAIGRWASALASRLKSQAHILTEHETRRMNTSEWLHATAERIYIQAWRCRPDKRLVDPLPPDLGTKDVRWLDAYGRNLEAVDRRAKESRRDEMTTSEWQEALGEALETIARS